MELVKEPHAAAVRRRSEDRRSVDAIGRGWLLLIIILCMLAARAGAQTASAKSSGSGVVETGYPNGLVLLSKEVHAAPVVSVWIYYRVGARDEVQGIFGISHQIEHMMFKGTQRLHPGDIDRLFSERGGENNAETTEDYTVYHETLPSSALGVALKVEADRMEHSAMNAAELAHEKTVVLSELDGDENSPLYKLDTEVTAAAFNAHPYHHPVIGYASDIRKFSPSQVRHYYATHYAPNNAILVVVGDFRTAELRRAVGYYFGADHARPIPSHPITREPDQEGERRVRVEGVGDTPYVEMGFHVPETGQRDHYVMDVISAVLAGGRSARLYRALVEGGLASEVDAGDQDLKDPSLMDVTATVAKGHTPDEVEKAIESELDRLKREPVSARELEKTINQVKASYVYRNDSVEAQASRLGFYAVLGDYRYDNTYLARLESITAPEIQLAAERYFTPENRTVGWFIPRAPRPGEALPGSGRGGAVHYHWRQAASGLSRFGVSGGAPIGAGGEIDPARWIGRRLHRHTRPARSHPTRTAPPPPLTTTGSTGHAEVVRQVLPNGMVVLVYPNHANPDVAISGSIRVGALADPPGKAGLANFVATMLDRGTKTRTEEQIASQLEFVGASAGVSAAGSSTLFSGQSLDEDLPLVMEILADELQNPAFPPAVFDRVKNEIETDIQVGNDDPETVASQNFYAALYPESYPLHWPMIGTAESVRGISRGDLEAFHRQYYRPDLAIISIVGDVDPPAAVALVEKYFGGWSAAGPAPTTLPPILQEQVPSDRVVKTMPDKSEEIVVMGFRGITRKDPDYYPAYLMNLILGSGDFNSRLMKDIRDRKGLVYGVSSGYEAGLVAGPWALEMQANPADVERAAASAIYDLRAIQRSGATPEEIRLFKGWISGSQALRLETSAQIAEGLRQSEFYDLGLDYIWRFPTLIRAVTPAQIQDAARRLLFPDNVVTSIAGPGTPGPAAAAAAAAAPVPATAAAQ